FKAGVLTIPRSKNGEARHVPFNAIVRDILARRARPIDRAALVFPNRDGNRDLRWAEKTVPAALDAARIEDFRLHDPDPPSPRGSQWKASIYSQSRPSVAGRR